MLPSHNKQTLAVTDSKKTSVIVKVYFLTKLLKLQFINFRKSVNSNKDFLFLKVKAIYLKSKIKVNVNSYLKSTFLCQLNILYILT